MDIQKYQISVIELQPNSGIMNYISFDKITELASRYNTLKL